MPDEKKSPRNTQDIQTEYQKLAFQAGNLQYELSCKHKDLDMINDTMRNLNFEFIASKQAEDASKAAAPASPEVA